MTYWQCGLRSLRGGNKRAAGFFGSRAHVWMSQLLRCGSFWPFCWNATQECRLFDALFISQSVRLLVYFVYSVIGLFRGGASYGDEQRDRCRSRLPKSSSKCCHLLGHGRSVRLRCTYSPRVMIMSQFRWSVKSGANYLTSVLSVVSGCRWWFQMILHFPGLPACTFIWLCSSLWL